MRNLPAPSRASDRLDLVRAIRRYRYAGQQLGHDITEAELERVIALYDKYEQDRGAPCTEFKGDDLPFSLREELFAAYDKTQEGRILHSVRERLLKDIDLCPVCGIGRAVELDHHLPRSVFKPLAIHTRNLVPMCHDCNLAKLAGFSDEGAGFLHPYYDVLPDIDFVQVSVNLNAADLVVSFSIDAAAALPLGYYDRLTVQMHDLKLNDRYQQEVNTYISSHAAALHLSYRASGQDGVREALRLQTQFEIRAFHRNHWRPVLLRALTDHEGFTDGGFADILPISEDMLEDLGG
ncbi:MULTISPECIES: HNH endonuclease [Hyphobacterium]|uniref:HNH endonuclease signature motif containing protein n=1 Tax=Hyphobacterium vulgare TaxID=1736751 RepID=A0ABV6ZWY9_9PROT